MGLLGRSLHFFESHVNDDNEDTSTDLGYPGAPGETRTAPPRTVVVHTQRMLKSFRDAGFLGQWHWIGGGSWVPISSCCCKSKLQRPLLLREGPRIGSCIAGAVQSANDPAVVSTPTGGHRG